MILETPKDQLLKMFVDKTLFNFLMKKGVIKKGDTVCYGKILGVSTEDLRSYFEKQGFPGLKISRHEIKKTPQGGEGDSEWTLNEGVYQVWCTERNTHTCVFTTESKAEFEAYWAREYFGEWDYKLNNEWVL